MCNFIVTKLACTLTQDNEFVVWGCPDFGESRSTLQNSLQKRTSSKGAVFTDCLHTYFICTDLINVIVINWELGLE